MWKTQWIPRFREQTGVRVTCDCAGQGTAAHRRLSGTSTATATTTWAAAVFALLLATETSGFVTTVSVPFTPCRGGYRTRSGVPTATPHRSSSSNSNSNNLAASPGWALDNTDHCYMRQEPPILSGYPRKRARCWGYTTPNTITSRSRLFVSTPTTTMGVDGTAKGSKSKPDGTETGGGVGQKDGSGGLFAYGLPQQNSPELVRLELAEVPVRARVGIP